MARRFAVARVGAGLAVLLVVALAGASPAHAGEDEPLVWPTVRYGWPDKWSAGIAVQPRPGGVWNRLVATLTIGTGAMKAGVGFGTFGGNLMGGQAVQLTFTRTTGDPLGAAPHESFVGVEAQCMVANMSFRLGPAVRVSQSDTSGRFRLNASLGFGF
jgi:hypothetical protein